MSWNTRIVGSDMVDPSILCPNPKNWRRHPKHQQDAMTNVFNEIGWIQDIIVNKTTGNIIDGHMRAELAVKNKEKLVPVKYVELSEEEERQALITYDPLSALAEQDNETLKQLLGDISNSIDMSKFDFGKDVMNSMLPHTDEELDDVPLVPDTPTTKLGDIIQLGRHRLMCGDCTDSEVVERLMQGEKADMVFTDPPYGVSYTGGIQFKSGGAVIDNRKMICGDDADIYPVLFDILPLVVNGPCYIWFAGTKARSLYESAERTGEIHAMIIWVKNGGYGALNANYKQKHEPCLYWKPKGATLDFTGATTETTVWDIDKDGVNKYHPTQKPIALAVKAIGNHANAKMVLDLFLGSGTTMIACENLGRKCRGCEIDPGYVAVILQRYKDTFPDKEIKLL